MPYELFFMKKPQLTHLKTYSCKAYAMTAETQQKKNCLHKLDSCAHIDFFVSYNSMNIYRI